MRTILAITIASLALLAAPAVDAKGKGKAKAAKVEKVKNFPSKAPKGK